MSYDDEGGELIGERGFRLDGEDEIGEPLPEEEGVEDFGFRDDDEDPDNRYH